MVQFSLLGLLAVSRFTETDRNGPKRTFVDTETDSLSTETDSLGTETDRNGRKRTFVDTETDSLCTETFDAASPRPLQYRSNYCDNQTNGFVLLTHVTATLS